MFDVLDKYIGSAIIFSILRSFFILVSISGIIKFIEQLKKVSNGGYSICDAGIFVLLMVPRDMEILFPMAALLGVLLALGDFVTRNELVVIQAAGFSHLRVIMSVMKASTLLLILMIIIGEWVAPVAEEYARNYRARKIVGQTLMIIDNGLWAKDGNNFIHIQHVINKYEIKDIFIYQFDSQKKLEAIIFAASGHYCVNTKQWHLLEVNKSFITNENKIDSSQSLSLVWKTNLNLEKLWAGLFEPSSLSIRSLYKYVKYLKESGQEAPIIYQLSMWKKILSPLSVSVMMLVAMSFIFWSLQKFTVEVGILFGISNGFIFYFLNEGFSNLGLVYGIPPLIIAVAPSAVFFIFGILLLIFRQ